jgi:predicted RNA binding protein YcfA (HicA-like mRNA interferase family)
MTQWDKLLQRIKGLDKNLRFAELQKILQNYGYEMTAPKSGSSHYTFRKDGCNPITIPKHEPIQVVYVKMVKAVVEEDNNNFNENKTL